MPETLYKHCVVFIVYIDLSHCVISFLKNLSEYHDLYVQSDTALLADVF